MDMQMYNLIKNAMKAGKSAEDIVKEVNNLAQTAKKELEPKTPIKNLYNGCPADAIVIDGKISKQRLINALASYFVQNGFEPDLCFNSEREYRAQVAGVIDRALSSLKAVAKVNKMENDGASDEDILGAVFGAIEDMIKDAIPAKF